MKHNPRMGLIDRIFKNSVPASKDDKKDARGAPASQSSTQFYEDDAEAGDTQTGRNAPRRELVQVILRDTMRRHGIPSDWIECRILSAVTRTGKRGLHVNFVVRQAHERLLPYVFPFQDSFERELARFEPRCRDWLLSLGWEFTGVKAADMPDPKSWNMAAARAAAVPGAAEALAAESAGPDTEVAQGDEEVERDLQALFAIRDAAMADTARPPAPTAEPPDFEDTHPGDQR
jgi:hypothetical protein